MIDRGYGFEKMLRGEVKPWMRSHDCSLWTRSAWLLPLPARGERE